MTSGTLLISAAAVLGGIKPAQNWPSKAVQGVGLDTTRRLSALIAAGLSWFNKVPLGVC